MSITIVGGGNPSGPTYPLKRSVRLRASASAYFNRTPATTTSQTIFTFSAWVKLGNTSPNRIYVGRTGSNFPAFGISIGNTGLATDQYTTGAAVQMLLQTTQVFRDPSAWYHVVLSYDTTQATAANRVKIYVNGVQVTAFSTATYPAQNLALNVNTTNTQYIGADPANSGYFDGYLTEVNFIDGQALTPTSFGAYNSYGVWSPAKYTGTYGTNGFYLPFTDNSTVEAIGYSSSNTNPELISNSEFTGSVTGWTARNGTTLSWQSGSLARVSNTASAACEAYITIPTVIGQTYYVQTFVSAVSLGIAGRTVGVYKSDDAALSVNASLVASGTVAGAYQGTFVATATTTYITMFGDTYGSGSADFGSVSVALNGYKNNWKPFNVSLTAGVTYDSMLDVPTLTNANNANFAVMSPITGTTNLSNGNLYLTGAGAYRSGYSTIAFPSTGKWYWEGVFTQANNNLGFGAASIGPNTPPNPLPNTNGIGITNGGFWYLDTSTGTSGHTGWAAATVVGMTWDSSTNTFAYTVDGTTYNTVGSVSTTDGRIWAPAAWAFATNDQLTLNFGQRPFTYTPRSGYIALNTYNLPAPTIPNGAAYMAATLYTGTGAALSVLNSNNTTTGVSFQPDFVWIKSRSAISNNAVLDSVRPSGYALYPNLTAVEGDNSTLFTGITSNGFNLAGTNVTYNQAAATYVGWQWKASNATAVINTSGSIPSTISANTTSGFSIVTYTGTGANATVGHGLGVAPKMIIVKVRSTTNDWVVYHSSIGNTGAVFLDLTNATSTSINYWNNTSPTSTAFTIGIAAGVNNSTSTFVAYCWAEIPGFSKFGSYTGNGSADGPFVYTGMRPRWVMIKRTDAVNDWVIMDTSRDTYNYAQQILWADLSTAETAGGTTTSIDILSNGFKPRGVGASINASGGTYIFAAFAENPFNYSLAR